MLLTSHASRLTTHQDLQYLNPGQDLGLNFKFGKKFSLVCHINWEQTSAVKNVVTYFKSGCYVIGQPDSPNNTVAIPVFKLGSNFNPNV